MKTMIQTENKFSLLSEAVDDCYRWDPLESLPESGNKREAIDPQKVVSIVHSAVEVCKTFNVPTTYRRGTPVYGMEVGDDRADISRDPLRLAIGLVTQEQVFAMVTSVKDTIISSRYWNFCEVTNAIPTATEQTFDYCRKNNGFDSLGFVDSPPLRIILDVSKGDGSHSSTASGKAAMLASRMRTPRDEFLQPLQLASFIQDGMLRTSMSSDPKYLPRIMGGSGARALFDNPDNVHLYSYAYKGGRCNRVYGSATRELYNCLSHLARGKASMPVLCRMLGDKQEYLHGTYSNMIFAPKHSFKDRELKRLPPPLIESTGGANRFNSSLNRLVRTRHLVTRTIALREWEYSKTIRARLLTRAETERLTLEELMRKSALREKFGFALSANTAFAHLLERNATWADVETLLKSDDHITLTSGATEFSKFDAEWLFSGAKYEDFSIEDLTITEDLYSRESVSEEQTFKVGGLTLRPIIGDKITNVKTNTKVGLYQIGSSMEKWAEDLFHRLLDRQEGDKPLSKADILTEVMHDPEWVNDDTGLIELCLHETRDLHQRSARVVLVTLDKRLANQMSNTCNVQVERLHPLTYILYLRDLGLDPIKDRGQALALLKDKIPFRERSDPVLNIYVDTGSVASVLSRMEEDPDEAPRTRDKVREAIASGIDNRGHRWSSYILRTPPEAARLLNTVPVRPVLRDRKFPHSQSRRGSWQKSRASSSSASASVRR